MGHLTLVRQMKKVCVTVRVLTCFILYLRAVSKCKPGRFNRRVFYVSSSGEGLYLEGHIHGGAYFRNFTLVYELPLGLHQRFSYR